MVKRARYCPQKFLEVQQSEYAYYTVNGDIEVFARFSRRHFANYKRARSGTVGDYDNDIVPDLMVKFDRATVVAWIGSVDYDDDTGKSENVALVITGEVAETSFEGSDTIRVLLK